MKSLLFVSIFLSMASLGFAAEESDSVRDAITGTNPRVEATMAISPLNQFLKNVFRPDQTVIENRSNLVAPYEEVLPIDGNYYRDRARYYEKPTYHETPPAAEKEYYEGGGLYYLPSKKKSKEK